MRQQLKDKLAERLQQPHVPADRPRGSDLKDCYKIKLRAADYRLVYPVDDTRIIVTVIAVGQRSGGAVYDLARRR